MNKRKHKQDSPEALEALREEVARHNSLYYQQGRPELSDAQYDALKRRLVSLEFEYPLFSGVLAPVGGGVGDDRVQGFAQCAHKTPMLSLDNGFNLEELEAFDERVRSALGVEAVEYCVEPKIDGVAINCFYKNGLLSRAVTRGNGVEGDDVTANLVSLEKIQKLGGPGPFPEFMELRGEVYLLNADFVRLNEERQQNGFLAFANPRNLAAGSLKLLDPQEAQSRCLQVVFYGLGACEPELFEKNSEVLAAIKAWGLPVNEPYGIAQGLKAVFGEIQKIEALRSTLPYGTDGAVLKVNRRDWQTQLGRTATAPRWALAYKFAPAQVQTQIKAITLQVGRTGVVTPVAELEPVLLAGSSINRATLHNADEIARKDVRVGDWVFLEKAGEVIPSVVSVVKERRPAHSQPFSFPQTCPACDSPLKRNEGEVAWRCLNPSCPPQVRRRLEHFCSRGAMDIQTLGPAVLSQLVERGLATSPLDLYALTEHSFLALPQFQEKSAQKAKKALQDSLRQPLWRLINGLGIPHVGSQVAKDLAGQFPSLSALAQADIPSLSALSGIGPLVAQSIFGFFQKPENLKLAEAFDRLLKEGASGGQERVPGPEK